jgi:exodeoxyribonuclease-3
MKIVSWNVNSLNVRQPHLEEWLKLRQPDVVCLQETKLEDHKFPDDALLELGYRSAFVGQKTYNGVAILARGVEPVVTRTRLPGDPKDTQARYIEAAINGVLVASLYLPNGNPAPGPKFDYKLAWMERLHAHAAALMATGAPVVLAGDYNVIPSDDDIYPNHSYAGNALLAPESRAAFRRLLDQGWTDALRAQHPVGPLWTFWSYLRNRWGTDHGMRLDHLLISTSLVDDLVDAGVDRWVRGEEEASDHAPTWIVLDR